MRRVVVTGLGAVTPLGVGIKTSWNNLLAGRCGVVSLRDRSPEYEDLPSKVAAVVPQATAEPGGWNPAEWLAMGDERRMALFSQYAIAAATEALNDSGWKPETEEQKERTGACVGSGIGNFADMYDTSVTYSRKGFKKVSPLFVPRLLINLAAGHVCMKFGFKGPNHSASTACTTGAHSIGDAFRFIQYGDADVMLAGGSEACIHPLAIAGFARAKSLATKWNTEPELSSRPFDRERAGFVMGEGAGVVVLEELEHAKRRGAKIYAELKGYGTSADAHHITAPPPDGAGAYAAMRRALIHAQISPEKVDYVNAHATSTPLGDAAENRAIQRLLVTDGQRKPGAVNISSCKGAIGHLLGAAGAVESIFTILALKNSLLPPTLNLDQPGNKAGEEGVEELAGEWDCNYVPKVAQEKEVEVALSNSFGFGGTNASLCFGKFRE
ncbi:3-oxoacyl-synth [Ascodesmis nigricans]|uniref:3-oxoacyl-[acyl-carrier-protein] synthase n=1 Tax=Ascodesmis nigricans TaxID=341454 RepID=A0A4S2N2Y3_9PEZI|nr:3-oxoacyl-synth [Ascodesmis nigricans]